MRFSGLAVITAVAPLLALSMDMQTRRNAAVPKRKGAEGSRLGRTAGPGAERRRGGDRWRYVR